MGDNVKTNNQKYPKTREQKARDSEIQQRSKKNLSNPEYRKRTNNYSHS